MTGIRRVGAVLTLGLLSGFVIGVAGVVAYGLVGLPATVAAIFALISASLVLLFGAERVLVAAVLLALPLQLNTHLGYQPVEGELGALGGLPISITTFALVGLIAMAATRRLLSRGSPFGAAPAGSLPLALFVAFVGLSAFWAEDAALALYLFGLLAQALVLYICFASFLRSRSNIRWAAGLLMAGLTAQGAFIVAQRAFGLEFGGALSAVLWQSPAGAELVPRASGTLGSPNTAAAYLSMLLVLAVAVSLSSARSRLTLLAGAAAGVGGLGLVFTLSRGGLIAGAVGTLVAVALATRRRLVGRKALIVASMAFALAAVVVGGDVMLRLFADDAGAGQGRIPLMWLAVEMFASAPIAGVGANNFATVLPRFLTPEFSQAWQYVVHNYYLQIAAENGLLGLTAFLAFFSVAIRNALVASRRLTGWDASLACGVLGALVARAVHMHLDVFGGPVQWEVLVVIAALGTGLARSGPPEEAKDPLHDPLSAIRDTRAPSVPRMSGSR